MIEEIGYLLINKKNIEYDRNYIFVPKTVFYHPKRNNHKNQIFRKLMTVKFLD
jgi:hypothetical protein